MERVCFHKRDFATVGVIGLIIFTSLSSVGDGTNQSAGNRKREIVYSIVDEDPIFWPKGRPYSVTNFYKLRLSSIPKEVDTLIYAPLASFAYLSAKIPSADQPAHQPVGSSWLAGRENMLPKFFEAGTDPLREVVKWAKAEKKELIVDLPFNNCDHGTSYDAAKPPPPWLFDNFLYPPFKRENPHLLMGSRKASKDKKAQGGPPPHAPWAAVDYGSSTVREKYKRIATELLQGYEVDGLCMDFMRGPYLFKSVAWGEAASLKESKALTEMVRAIRRAAKEASRKRGRPVVLTVTIPDSVPFCKNVGIDIETWMGEKLIDFVIAGGTFQLNPWASISDVCKKAKVPFYAALDISGIWVGNDNGGAVDDDRIPRQCSECYRARVMEAKTAGAAGIVFSDYYWWYRVHPSWFCGRIEDIRLKDKRYFVTYRNGWLASHCLKGGEQFRTLPQLISGNPVPIKGGAVKQEIYLWDRFADLKKDGIQPELILTTEAILPSGTDITVMANGQQLKLIKKRAGCQIFTFPLSAARFGKNEIMVRGKGRNKRGRISKLGNIAVDVIFPKEEKKKEQKHAK